MPKKSRDTIRNNIRGDLKKQLKDQNKIASQWDDLVEDYLALWDIKEGYIKEVRKFGAMVSCDNGKQILRKKNDAAVELPKINKRMTELLSVLNLETEEGVDDEEDTGL